MQGCDASPICERAPINLIDGHDHHPRHVRRDDRLLNGRFQVHRRALRSQ